MFNFKGKKLVIKDPLLALVLPTHRGKEGTWKWKIFDVIVDGASLLNNYKYQFDSIIRKNGYEDLIRRMEAKLKTMKEKESVAITTQ